MFRSGLCKQGRTLDSLFLLTKEKIKRIKRLFHHLFFFEKEADIVSCIRKLHYYFMSQLLFFEIIFDDT